MGNRQTKTAQPQSTVTARKLDPESEPITVKREFPVAIPETPPQPSEPTLDPPLEDSSPTKDTTQAQEPFLEEPVVEDGEIKEHKESKKELLEPLPVLLNESESVEEELKKSEEGVHAMGSVTEQNETVLVTVPVTDQEVIFEDPIPITSEDTTANETKEITKESKIEDISKTTSEMNVDQVPEAVLLDSKIAVCKEEETSEGKNEEEEIADSKTPSIVMETASISSSAIKMDEEYMKGIMGTSLAFPDATSNESVIGSLAVSEQTLDESLWDNTGLSKSSIKCPPPPKEEPLVFVDFGVIDQTVRMVLTSSEPVQKDDQKKHDMIPEETPEHEIPEIKEVQSKSVLDPLDEELPAPAQSQSMVVSDLDKSESFVSVEFHEENNEIKVGMNCVSKTQIASCNSMISDKQVSVELNTPFENVEDDASLNESKSGDALSKSKSSDKTKTKKPKKSTSMKSTESGIEGDLESMNAQIKGANSGQSKLSKSSSSSSASGRGKGSRGRGRGRKN